MLRRWSREIVAASFELGVSVAVVARRYEVNANQVFSWRRLYRYGLLGSGAQTLVPVTVAEAPTDAALPSGVADTIEIDDIADVEQQLGASHACPKPFAISVLSRDFRGSAAVICPTIEM
jgi:transposase